MVNSLPFIFALQATQISQANRTLIEIRNILKRMFKNNVQKGRAKQSIRLRIIPNGDWVDTREKVGKAEVRSRLPFLKDNAPEKIRQSISYQYGGLNELPPRLMNMNKNTKLTREETRFVVTNLSSWALGGDPDAFYSRSKRTIFVKESEIRDGNYEGILAHEMVHAYESPQWDMVMTALGSRNMPNVEKVIEGATSILASKIAAELSFSRGKNVTIPVSGYGLDYDQAAQNFINDPSELAEAYFRGSIKYTNRDSPEDSLEVGLKKRPVTWPWRATRSPRHNIFIPRGDSQPPPPRRISLRAIIEKVLGRLVPTRSEAEKILSRHDELMKSSNKLREQMTYQRKLSERIRAAQQEITSARKFLANTSPALRKPMYKRIDHTQRILEKLKTQGSIFQSHIQAHKNFLRDISKQTNVPYWRDVNNPAVLRSSQTHTSRGFDFARLRHNEAIERLRNLQKKQEEKRAIEETMRGLDERLRDFRIGRRRVHYGYE